MSDCRVFRRASTRTFWTTGKRAGRAVRTWVAVCPEPECAEVIRLPEASISAPTRKNAKDALHRHIRLRHS